MFKRKNKTHDHRFHSETGKVSRKVSQFGAVLFVSAIFGVCAWGWMLMTDSATAPINTVKVSGVFRHLDATAVSSMVAAETRNKGFFTANLHDVEAALHTLPWLYSASIRREWPNTLHITVIEQQAVARWRDGGLVNPLGEVFTPDENTYPTGLPVFRGPGSSGALLVTKYHEMSKQLQGLAFRVNELVLDDRRSWSLLLNQDVAVMLGRTDQEQRLKRLIRFYSKVATAAPAPVELIDLRYSNGFAVRFKPTVSDISRETTFTLPS